MHKAWLCTGIAVLGVAFALGGHLAVRGNAQTAHPFVVFAPWPPPPDEIVNVDGEQHVTSGSKHTLYQVPTDRTLIVTDILLDAEIGSEGKYGGYFDLLEQDAAGVNVTKVAFRHLRPLIEAGAQRITSVTGLRFAPASSVGARRPAATTCSGASRSWRRRA